MSSLVYQSGFPFPMFGPGPKGRINYVTCDVETLVASSIQQIVRTMIGERMDEPTFGCRIHELAFETMDEATLGLARLFVYEAISLWEPRVFLQQDDILVKPNVYENNRLRIDVIYVIITPDATQGQKSLTVFI